MGKYKAILSAVFFTALLSSNATSACDVYVQGYYRSDGTYVRPHCRSQPDAVKWNNYGPSRSSSELLNPYSRDNDNDGIPNLYDMDDDNDGLSDDNDSSQYGENGWWDY